MNVRYYEMREGTSQRSSQQARTFVHVWLGNLSLCARALAFVHAVSLASVSVGAVVRCCWESSHERAPGSLSIAPPLPPNENTSGASARKLNLMGSSCQMGSARGLRNSGHIGSRASVALNGGVSLDRAAA